ncbi:Hypothetical protein PHPALM_15664 [Phytophthora palmivora]|uniref:DIRP domain-containing protein n=1 Tax=Phytophthora palmivora TaxID=4796 RepID=A0A2P4XRN0_9STRA|nr:Hypothetical protein PHPALM_15664 [Phytophthora palmivora]
MDVKQEPMEHNDRSRKKRRMEKLLATDQLATLRVQAEETVESAERTKRGGRKSSTPRRSRFWIPRGDDRKLQGPKFELSWCHWFYSYIDVDFFRHNEFVQCLGGMVLEKITAAARPIWSSVRASMGHSRQLSPLFFDHEKEKPESYRAVKCRLDLAKMLFRLATVVAFHTTEETCQVNFCRNTSHVDTVTCNLNNVMVLDFPSTKPAATTLLRRENGVRGTFATPKTVDSVGDRYHEEKISAVLTVKSLLHRKENLISVSAI